MDEIATQSVMVEAVKYVTAGNLTELSNKVNNHVAKKWAMYGSVQVIAGLFVQTLVIPSGLPSTAQAQALSVFDDEN